MASVASCLGGWPSFTTRQMITCCLNYKSCNAETAPPCIHSRWHIILHCHVGTTRRPTTKKTWQELRLEMKSCHLGHPVRVSGPCCAYPEHFRASYASQAMTRYKKPRITFEVNGDRACNIFSECSLGERVHVSNNASWTVRSRHGHGSLQGETS